MPRGKKFTAEQVIGRLREAEVGLAQGKTVPEVVRKLGVTEQTYYRWKREYGGLRADQAKRLKDLEKENARLKRLLADAELDKAILREAASSCRRRGERPPQPALTALIASRVDTFQPVFQEATHGSTGRSAEGRGMAAAAAAVHGIRHDGVEVLRSSGCIGRRFPLLAAEARSAAA
jgi:transposase-like protein